MYVRRLEADHTNSEIGDPARTAGSERLVEILQHNELVWECLCRLCELELPGWYLGAGCIAQTIWNVAHAKTATADIADYDVVYFDPDLSAEAENKAAARVGKLFADLPVRLDVKNHARVHLWYEARFGYRIRAYASSEEAITTWSTTATAVAIRWVDGVFGVYAPFGTNDLFDLVVRPNRVQITPEIYAAKVACWRERWPLLKILAWDQGIGVSGARWVL